MLFFSPVYTQRRSELPKSIIFPPSFLSMSRAGAIAQSEGPLSFLIFSIKKASSAFLLPR